MKISVQTLTGIEMQLNVDPLHRVVDVKSIIQNEWDFPLYRQSLLHQGEVLEDQLTLGECGIKADDIIYVLISAAQEPIEEDDDTDQVDVGGDNEEEDDDQI